MLRMHLKITFTLLKTLSEMKNIKTNSKMMKKNTVQAKLDSITSWFESNKETASVEELEAK